MKYKLLLIFITLASFAKNSLAENQIVETEYFRFHNNYWINFHHFIFQKASGNQERKLNEDGNEFLDIGEKELWSSLSSEENNKISGAIEYYKDNLIEKSLLFDLEALRIKFQNSNDLIIPDTVISADFAKILIEASSVYKTKFWPLHQKHNDEIIQFHLEAIKSMEKTVIQKMEKLSQNEWPLDKGKVRIDLSAYANFAGAYTPSGKQFNTILSTLDPMAREKGFIEIIFHESSHLLFGFGSPFRNIIFFKAKELEIPFPRNLWHACQFYLCGKVVQSEFVKNNIQYDLLMDKRNIFSDYNSLKFRAILDRYMNNEITLEITSSELLKEQQYQ